MFAAPPPEMIVTSKVSNLLTLTPKSKMDFAAIFSFDLLLLFQQSSLVEILTNLKPSLYFPSDISERYMFFRSDIFKTFRRKIAKNCHCFFCKRAELNEWHREADWQKKKQCLLRKLIYEREEKQCNWHEAKHTRVMQYKLIWQSEKIVQKQRGKKK